jgi:hypothetical protein
VRTRGPVRAASTTFFKSWTKNPDYLGFIIKKIIMLVFFRIRAGAAGDEESIIVHRSIMLQGCFTAISNSVAARFNYSHRQMW